MSLDKRFFKYWFLHALAFWLFFVMTSTGHYMYRTFFWDDLYKEKDGTVITAWVYFLLYDTKPIIFITLSVISLLNEHFYKLLLNII